MPRNTQITRDLREALKMSLQWQQLRPWKNSVNSGFEELYCQLAEYEPHPPGSVFVRKGTPDGGVECFGVFPTGSEWGWQAKFLFLPFEQAQWQQVDKSVRTALEKHPNLSRYTICLPFDRPDGRTKGQKSFLDHWNLRVKKWEARAKQLGKSVQFDYWGDHEIYERLSREEHVGRFKFWFDQEFLSKFWFDAHIREVVANAGDRYTPELNVELPIGQVFEGLGRTPAFFSLLDSHLRKIGKAYRLLSLKKLSELNDTHALSLQENIGRLFRQLDKMRDHNWEQLPFGDLGIAQFESGRRCMQVLRERENETKNAAATMGGQVPAVDLRNEIYELGELLRSLGPRAEVQLCIVHLVRAALNYVPWFRIPLQNSIKNCGLVNSGYRSGTLGSIPKCVKNLFAASYSCSSKPRCSCLTILSLDVS
jgi:hypothetical protein